MTRSLWFGRSLSTLGLAVATSFACHEEESKLLPIEPSMLVFRVVDEGGPLVRTELDVSIEQTILSDRKGTTSSRAPMVTDDAGFLRCALAMFESDDPIKFVVTVVSSDAYVKQVDVIGRGEKRIDDLMLASMPVLAAGSVIDAEGQPVSGARVAAPLAGMCRTAVTNENGEFVLHVPRELEPKAQLVTAALGERIGTVPGVREGVTGVVVTLDGRAGSFTGKVLLDDPIPSERIGVHLMPDGRWGLDGVLMEERSETEGVLDPEGAFLFSHLIPGKFWLLVNVDGLELARLDVIVEEGSIVTDPRCDPLDLRGKIHVIRLGLVAPTPESALEGYFAVSRPEWGWSHVPFDGPDVLVLAPYEELDIQLVVQGFRSLRLEAVREDRTVNLQPGWPMRLVLEDDVLLPEPPASWSAVIFDKGEPVFPPLEFEPGAREARGIAGRTGEFEVGWIRHEDGADDVPWFAATRGGYHGWPHQMVEVRDVPGEQVLRLGWVPVPR